MADVDLASGHAANDDAGMQSRRDHRTFDAARPIAWDPHEIWLKRIQQPRARAAGKAAA